VQRLLLEDGNPRLEEVKPRAPSKDEKAGEAPYTDLLRREKGDEWTDTRWLPQATERQRKGLNAIYAISESTGLNSQDLVTDLNKTYKEQAF